MRSPAVTALLAAVFALTACAAPQPPPEAPQPDYALSGKVANPADLPLPNFVSYVTVQPSYFQPALADVTEYPGGLLAIDSAPLTKDGAFAWDLGDGSDVPAPYFALANQAFVFLAEEVTCDLSATKLVPVLRVHFSPTQVVPTAILGPLSQGTAFADGQLVYTDQPAFPPPAGTAYRLGAWVYAVDEVTVEGSCLYDDGVDPPFAVGTVEVHLAAGWNPITYLTDPAEEMVTITDGAFEGQWVAYVAGPEVE